MSNRLSGRSSSKSLESVRAEQLAGYAQSCVYPLGPSQTGYVIPLRLATDRAAGSIIADWSFVPPWEDHIVFWDSAPEDIIPKRLWGSYQKFFESRLMAVLNEHRLLRRGTPVDGLLCGCAYQPIGVSTYGCVSARLVLRDDSGKTVKLRIRLDVDNYDAGRRPAL